MTNPSNGLLGQRAVVMGGSMAGLLAARVLSQRFAEVLVLERDALPEGAAPRKGTPQAVHPHGLLARGREVIEQLFPGITQELLGLGALGGDLQRDVAFDADRQRMAAGECGHLGLAVSRLALEAELRRRVRAQPNVRVMTGVDVIAPVLGDGQQRVIGVRCRDLAAGEGGATIGADLVVDCTGRGSRTPAWLASWGYDAPAEDQVDVGVCYVSAYFEREDEFAFGRAIHKAGLICAATPALPRPAVMIAQEPDANGTERWVVGVGGYKGDHPLPTIDGMRERAASIGSLELIRLTHDARLLGEPLRYHFPFSLRRRYERLKRFPTGYLVLGDAIASFNPIYGQGMTVAACEALALQHALDAGRSDLAQRFFRSAAKVIDTPWDLAVGSDLALPGVPGPRPLAVRILNAYVARLYRAAARDPVVARAFLKVVHLVAAPPSLFAPPVLWRVLFHGGRAHASPTGTATATRPVRV